MIGRDFTITEAPVGRLMWQALEEPHPLYCESPHVAPIKADYVFTLAEDGYVPYRAAICYGCLAPLARTVGTDPEAGKSA